MGMSSYIDYDDEYDDYEATSFCRWCDSVHEISEIEDCKKKHDEAARINQSNEKS